MTTYSGYCWGGPEDGSFFTHDYSTINICIYESMPFNPKEEPDVFGPAYTIGRYKYNWLRDRWEWEKIVSKR